MHHGATLWLMNFRIRHTVYYFPNLNIRSWDNPTTRVWELRKSFIEPSDIIYTEWTLLKKNVDLETKINQRTQIIFIGHPLSEPQYLLPSTHPCCSQGRLSRAPTSMWLIFPLCKQLWKRRKCRCFPELVLAWSKNPSYTPISLNLWKLISSCHP